MCRLERYNNNVAEQGRNRKKYVAKKKELSNVAKYKYIILN